MMNSAILRAGDKVLLPPDGTHQAQPGVVVRTTTSSAKVQLERTNDDPKRTVLISPYSEVDIIFKRRRAHVRKKKGK